MLMAVMHGAGAFLFLVGSMLLLMRQSRGRCRPSMMPLQTNMDPTVYAPALLRLLLYCQYPCRAILKMGVLDCVPVPADMAARSMQRSGRRTTMCEGANRLLCQSSL